MDFSKIKAFAFDVDGVFTDGGVFCNLDGELFRTFDSKDGFSIRMATMYGYPVGIITGGRSGSIRARFRSCGVEPEDVYLGSRKKIEQFDDFCKRHSLSRDEVLYAGDDLPDIEVLVKCGIGACPADAVQEVKDASDYISTRNGGKCFVRELVEAVMRSQGRWVFDADAFKAKY